LILLKTLSNSLKHLTGHLKRESLRLKHPGNRLAKSRLNPNHLSPNPLSEEFIRSAHKLRFGGPRQISLFFMPLYTMHCRTMLIQSF
jgi:hypothetical protein